MFLTLTLPNSSMLHHYCKIPLKVLCSLLYSTPPSVCFFSCLNHCSYHSYSPLHLLQTTLCTCLHMGDIVLQPHSSHISQHPLITSLENILYFFLHCPCFNTFYITQWSNTYFIHPASTELWLWDVWYLMGWHQTLQSFCHQMWNKSPNAGFTPISKLSPNRKITKFQKARCMGEICLAYEFLKIQEVLVLR